MEGRIKHMSHLQVDQHAQGMHRMTSIICTIGPKVNNVESLQKLFTAGMNVVRMNFSHGTHEYHKSVIDNTRKLCGSHTNSPFPVLGIALDTKGPEIRTGLLKPGLESVTLQQGQSITISTDPANKEACDDKLIYVDYTNMPKVLAKGNTIYIDDGLISIVVDTIDGTNIVGKVQNTAELSSRKGVNLPGIAVDLPAVSEKDKGDLAFGVEQGVDMIFASFIRKAQDVRDVRAVLGEKGKNIKIISKIENFEGWQRFDEILAETDGVMVARGDLGIEIPAEKVFLAQKNMIAKCNLAGKPIICATQMLESMTYNPRPTRAEVSDVANAVLDGADCVMLSGETAKGKYPVESVTVMSRICREAEASIAYRSIYVEIKQLTPSPLVTTEAICSAAVQASHDIGAKAIICLTQTGNSARLVAKYRPKCPVVAMSRNAGSARQIHLYRGCFPVYLQKPRSGDWQADVEERIQLGFTIAKQKGFVTKGDRVIVIQGWASGPGHINAMRSLIVD